MMRLTMTVRATLCAGALLLAGLSLTGCDAELVSATDDQGYELATEENGGGESSRTTGNGGADGVVAGGGVQDNFKIYWTETATWDGGDGGGCVEVRVTNNGPPVSGLTTVVTVDATVSRWIDYSTDGFYVEPYGDALVIELENNATVVDRGQRLVTYYCAEPRVLPDSFELYIGHTHEDSEEGDDPRINVNYSDGCGKGSGSCNGDDPDGPSPDATAVLHRGDFSLISEQTQTWTGGSGGSCQTMVLQNRGPSVADWTLRIRGTEAVESVIDHSTDMVMYRERGELVIAPKDFSATFAGDTSKTFWCCVEPALAPQDMIVTANRQIDETPGNPDGHKNEGWFEDDDTSVALTWRRDQPWGDESLLRFSLEHDSGDTYEDWSVTITLDAPTTHYQPHGSEYSVRIDGDQVRVKAAQDHRKLFAPGQLFEFTLQATPIVTPIDFDFAGEVKWTFGELEELYKDGLVLRYEDAGMSRHGLPCLEISQVVDADCHTQRIVRLGLWMRDGLDRVFSEDVGLSVYRNGDVLILQPDQPITDNNGDGTLDLGVLRGKKICFDPPQPPESLLINPPSGS